MTTIYSNAEIRQAVRHLPADQDRSEVRFFSLVIAGFFMGDMVRNAVLILLEETAVVHAVAKLSRFGPQGIAALLLLAGLLALPIVGRLLFNPASLSSCWPRRLATWGACLATVTWAYMASLSEPLDYAVMTWVLAGKAMGAAIVAGLFAQSINAQQVREILNDGKSAIG